MLHFFGVVHDGVDIELHVVELLCQRINGFNFVTVKAFQ
jgi:hypothetical protein